jgi:hypothetical protein
MWKCWQTLGLEGYVTEHIRPQKYILKQLICVISRREICVRIGVKRQIMEKEMVKPD